MNIDAALFAALNEHCPRWLAEIFLYITPLGSGPFALGLVFVLAWFWRREPRRPVTAALAVGVAFGIDQVLKRIIERPRPWTVVPGAHVVGEAAHGYSFPSAHSTIAFALGVSIAFLAPKWRIPALVLAALVALSRVLVGAHYPGDVLGGAALGTATALFIAWALRRWPPGSIQGVAR